MARWKGVLLSILAAALTSVPAFAQIGGRPIELSGGAGWSEPDARSFRQSGFAYNGAIGLRWTPLLSFEAQGTWMPSALDANDDLDYNFSTIGADVRWNLVTADSRMVPFVLTGFAYGLSHTGIVDPAKLERGAPSVGLGLLWNVFDQRSYLRFQVRDVMFRERFQQEFSNHMVATAGLQWVLGGKPKDQDLDGVRDWLDKCPNTPLGAKVDASGCPTDSDKDKVFDGLDKCEGTPAGCTVNKDGCPTDADGDGVCDGVDQCADTPKGATVDAKGCPMDTDGDGVFDGIDKCENTPKGATIDATGCPADADGDGVFDGLDQCPNTPAGLKVDPNGCPIEISEKETELLDTGTIRLQDIQFDTGKATIKPESFPILDEVGRILQQYPMLQIEVGGHTDNKGSKALNDRLSQSRADSVMSYMKDRFPMLPATQLTSKGYGFANPVAPNTTDLGRSKNRRVEFKVLNTEALKIEREKRRFLQKDETAPPK